MLIVYASDEACGTLAQALARQSGGRCVPACLADAAALEGERALLLVLPDYYSSACWQMKRWIAAHSHLLRDRLCACLVLCAGGAGDAGGELAIRTIVSQMLAGQGLVYLCAVVCADGRIRPGGCAEADGMDSMDYCTKIERMAAIFG